MDWLIMFMTYGVILLMASCRVEYVDRKYSEERVDDDSSLFIFTMLNGGYNNVSRCSIR